MKKIYVFGNPLIEEDSLPIKLIPSLQKVFPNIDFIVVDPNENFPPEGEKNITIIDTIQDIKKPSILDLEDLKEITNTPITPHDYDLSFHLFLLKKRKKIDRVRIIGIPSWYDRIKMVDIVLELERIISNLPAKNARHRTYRDQRRG
ncbi:hypothetical protein HY612_04910 [Candidatus Roizmanbacteria bacterium]|nr:hypothetical protein [Candidatus Roizmanbacteria bacterium]